MPPWISIPLAVLVGLVTLVILIGYLMPVRYEGATQLEFSAGVDQVWTALQDAQAHPMTGKMMKSIEPLPPTDGRPNWKEDMGHGEIITVTTSAFEQSSHMVREMSSASVNMKSRWEYQLEPTESGCRVTLSGITDIERGTWHTPMFRVMMKLGGGVKTGLDTQLKMVAATLGSS